MLFAVCSGLLDCANKSAGHRSMQLLASPRTLQIRLIATNNAIFVYALVSEYESHNAVTSASSTLQEISSHCTRHLKRLLFNRSGLVNG